MSVVTSGVDQSIEVRKDQEKYNVKLGVRKWKQYPEYKDSGVKWNTEVPMNWVAKPLKRLVENIIVKGMGKELPFVALEHIVSGTGQLTKNFEWQIVKADDYLIFTKGDILFGKLRPYLRKYYFAEEDGCCPTELLVLRPFEEEICNKYLFYIVQSFPLIYLTDSTSYGVKMPRTSWEKISSEYFIIPALLEQQEIIIFLDRETSKIDTLIEKKQHFIELLEEKRFSLISHVVTKGLDPAVKMKDSEIEWIGETPENWKIMRLGYLSQVIDPQPDHRAPAMAVGEGFPYVGIRDVNFDGSINIETTRKVEESAIIKQESSFKIEKGDIVFCKVGTLGFPRHIKPECRIALSATLVLIKTKSIANNHYLRYFSYEKLY